MTQVLDPTLADSTTSVVPDTAEAQAPETPPAPTGSTASGPNGATEQLRIAAAASALEPRQAVRGRYQATTGTWQVDLRVDVDGSRTTRRVSGDLFSVSGATT